MQLEIPGASYFYSSMLGHARLASSAMRHLTSGERISMAFEAPSSMGILARLESNRLSQAVLSQSLSETSKVLDVAEGGLQQIQNVLQQLYGMAVQSASGTTSATARAQLQSAFSDGLAEINRLAVVTRYEDRYLLDGSLSGEGLGALQQIIDISAGTYMTIDIGGADTAHIGLGGTTAELDAGSQGIIGVSNHTYPFDGGTITITAVDVPPSHAVITGSAPLPVAFAPVGSLILTVDGVNYTASFTGPTAASVTGSGAYTSPLVNGGTLDLTVNSGNYSINMTGATPAFITGSAPPPANLTTSGNLVLTVDGTPYTTALIGSSAASVTGAGVVTSPLIDGGTLNFSVDGTPFSSVLSGSTQALLTASGAATSPLLTGGTLALTIDGTPYSVGLTGASAAVLTGTAPMVAPLEASQEGATLDFSVDGTPYSVLLNGDTAAVFTTGAGGPAANDFVPGGNLDIEVDGVTYNVNLNFGTVDTGPALTRIVNQINASLGGVATANHSNVGGNFFTITSTSQNGTSSTVRVLSSSDAGVIAALQLGGLLDTTFSGTDGDTLASLQTKLNTALGTAGTASDDGSGALVITSSTSGAASSVVIDGASTANLALLGFTGGQTATGTDGQTLAQVAAAVNAVIGGAGIASDNGAGVFQLEASSVGTGSSIVVGAGSTAGVLTQLQLTGGQSASGTDGDSLAQVAAILTAAMGGAGVAQDDGSGALEIRSSTVGSSSTVSIDAGSTANLLTELQLTLGQSSAGVDGDTFAQVQTKINAVLGAAATATDDGSGRLLVTSSSIGASASVAVSGTSTAGVLTDLGLVAGQSDLGANGDSIATVVAKINAALGAVGSATTSAGRLRIYSDTTGAATNVTILGSSTGALLTELGLTAGQTNTGTDGLTVAQVLSSINTALGASGTASTNGTGALVVTTAATGSSTWVQVAAGSTAAVVSALGLTDLQSDWGEDILMTITATHSNGTTDSLTVVPTASTLLYEGDLAGLEVLKDSSVTTAAGVSATITLTGTALASIDTAVHAQSALPLLRDALDTVSAQRAALYDAQNRTRGNQELADFMAFRATADLSEARDADFAIELARLVKSQLLMAAGSAFLRQLTEGLSGQLLDLFG